MNENMNSLKISGYGSCAGGEFYKVSIEGKGTINGDIKCNSFDTSGLGKITGNIETQKLDVSGVLSIKGDTVAKSVDISGVNKINGNLSGHDLKCDGTITTDNDVEFEEININGSISNKGFINCENLTMFLWGTSICNEIGASNIIVEGNGKNGSIFNIFIPKKYKENKLIANIIEGDEIILESSNVKIVKGKNIKIGPNCEIDEIEYSGSIEIDPSSKVINVNKI
ncbi:MAG: hypothetical protein ACRC92_13615 [Peptostreptococcaceae bacterium]